MRSSLGAVLALLVLASIPIWYAGAPSLRPASLPGMPAPDMPEPASGWHSAPSRDAAVLRAARFAVAAQSRQADVPLVLLAIKHVRQQRLPVPAYSMNLLVLREGHRQLAIAEVVEQADGRLALARWHWV